MVGIDGVDDAGIYKLNDEMALVLTTDFFPPIVDDPYLFGQVAAANALSDVYAMGGKPLAALNILTVPADMPADVTGDILRGGADKIGEAGAVIAGGHSIKDKELKYGLAVTGIIHPNKIFTNKDARPGDILILTKPLGTGIVSTAIKQNKAQKEHVDYLCQLMIALNKIASEAMIEFGAHAATDITGFGLAGHSYEMASGSGVSFEIEYGKLKLLPGTIDYAKAGALTGGASANKSHLEGKISIDSFLESYASDIVFDPQTSGGLLISIDEKNANDCLDYLIKRNVNAAIIGRVLPQEKFSVIIKP